MKISNDRLGSACSVIDTADLAHVQGGASTFPPGDGSPHPRANSSPRQPPAPAPLACPPGMSPNLVHFSELHVSTPIGDQTIGPVETFWCSSVPPR